MLDLRRVEMVEADRPDLAAAGAHVEQREGQPAERRRAERRADGTRWFNRLVFTWKSLGDWSYHASETQRKSTR
jgi:hypothetical protein